MLDDLGLVATCAGMRTARLRGPVSPAIRRGLGCARLSDELTIACFRVVQEALTNVVRHARARQVWVELRQRDDEIELTIRDDGIGFDPETARRRATHGESFGLLGIKERAELLGGRTAIHSRVGDGTHVHAFFPIESPPALDGGEHGSPL